MPAFAQSSAGRPDAFPRLDPDPQAIEYYRPGDQGYSWAELAEISLWASVHDPKQKTGSTPLAGNASSRLEQILSLAEAVKSSPGYPETGREKAEFILAYLHKNILKNYAVNQSRVDVLLAGGRYNCVSSAVLYMVLCKSTGLDVSGVMTKVHAFVSVRINGEDIDVETTSPYGFDPGNRKEFHDQFGKLTGFAYVPARNYRDRQTITPIELVSLILSNRITELESRNNFTESIPLAVDRAALLTGLQFNAARDGEEFISTAVEKGAEADSLAAFFENPRQDLLNRLSNYGAFLLNSGREEDCLRWVSYAAPGFPAEKLWQNFILAAVNNRITKYARANNFTDARSFLDAQKAALSPANYAQLDSMLLDTELLSRANRIRSAEDGDSVITAINEVRSGGKIDGKRAQELLTFAVQKTAAAISAAPSRDLSGAVYYIEKAIARLGSNRELEESLRTYKNNLAGDFHNRFAAAWNKRNFDEAVRILDEGLAEFPADRRLLADRETVNKNRP